MKRAVRFVLSVCLLIQISDQTADRGLRIRAKLFEHEPRTHKLTTGQSMRACGWSLRSNTKKCPRYFLVMGAFFGAADRI